jgi:3-deoxy-D-manno-octulosonate 8-phosphate phosphatase (KDO 8-P phosphatase)
MEKNYKEYLNDITTFVFDVDGGFTDGSVMITESGDMLRSMNVKDGYALKTALLCGYRVCIITGGSSEGVRKRFEGLGVNDIHLGAHQKLEVFEGFLKKYNLTTDEILYMGDDLPDIPPMGQVALPCCPQNAVPEVKEASRYISHKDGGKGCVRDVIEQVLKVRGDWHGNYSAKND